MKKRKIITLAAIILVLSLNGMPAAQGLWGGDTITSGRPADRIQRRSGGVFESGDIPMLGAAFLGSAFSEPGKRSGLWRDAIRSMERNRRDSKRLTERHIREAQRTEQQRVRELGRNGLPPSGYDGHVAVDQTPTGGLTRASGSGTIPGPLVQSAPASPPAPPTGLRVTPAPARPSPSPPESFDWEEYGKGVRRGLAIKEGKAKLPNAVEWQDLSPSYRKGIDDILRK